MKRYLLLFGSVFAFSTHAAISVRDAMGDTVTLPRPAQRIISLAPHATEMLYAAGGAERIVATVNYSDYPPQARKLPRVGDNQLVDIERLLAFKPDLLVVWRHNASSQQMEQLRKLGIPLFYSEPHKLADIPDELVKLGQLMGTETQAQQKAAELRKQIDSLTERYRNRPTVRVFYQVWHRPIYTLNDGNIVSDAIHVCGGENIFGKLASVAPSITPEAVLQENPEAIVSGDRRDQAVSGVEVWRKYPSMLAVRSGNLFALDADLMNRSGPRMIAGAAELCERLEQARQRRGARQ